jgi:hypothetical protein
MAEIWGAALVAGATVVSAGAGYASARSASRAAQSGADAATAEQARQYDQTRADYAPYRVTGTAALNQLGRLYGLPTTSAEQFTAQQDRLIGDRMLPADARLVSTDGGRDRYYDVYLGDQLIGSVRPGGSNGRFTPAAGVDTHQLMRERQLSQQQQQTSAAGSPDMSVFFESPDYQFNLAEGQKAIDRSLAARGRTLSGAGVKEGIRYASGMASNEFGNFYNRLANLAGIGQAATGSTAAAGMNAANNISNNHLFAANARANGYMQTGQAVNNAVQGGISNYLLGRYLGGPGGGSPTPYGGTPPYAPPTYNNWNGPRQ